MKCGRVKGGEKGEGMGLEVGGRVGLRQGTGGGGRVRGGEREKGYCWEEDG